MLITTPCCASQVRCCSYTSQVSSLHFASAGPFVELVTRKWRHLRFRPIGVAEITSARLRHMTSQSLPHTRRLGSTRLSKWLRRYTARGRSRDWVTMQSLNCGIVVRAPDYRSWRPGFDSQGYWISWEVAGLECVPLSLVRIMGEICDWKRWD
jgi:hypothetical protein